MAKNDETEQHGQKHRTPGMKWVNCTPKTKKITFSSAADQTLSQNDELEKTEQITRIQLLHLSHRLPASTKKNPTILPHTYTQKGKFSTQFKCFTPLYILCDT